MKNRSLGILIGNLWVALVAALVFGAPAGAATVTGRTPGSFAVSPTGAATYSIPIWAPPGPRGLQPNIALTYNSQQGNGYLGVGWGLSGLSSIYRCNLTSAQDAAAAPVALVTGDGYCMDGQRLRLTGGTYGASGSTYQTEIANFSNVTASSVSGVTGIGYFSVQARNGLTYTYGNTTDSRVRATGTTTAVSWQLNEVTDRSSNTMTIAYTQTSGTAVPATISWTPSSHGSSSYNYAMKFNYGSNALPVQGYVAGTSFMNANLLSSITINMVSTSTVVKNYVLAYQVSAVTGRDELKQVQECSDSGATNCLAPTVITYQPGAEGVSTSATSFSHPVSYVHYDFNGDGYPDLLYNNGTDWYVAWGSGSGYGTPVSTGIPSSAAQVIPGDLTASGHAGLLAAVGGTWYYYTWNGSSFVSSSITGLTTYDASAKQYLLADINGNGLPDLIASYYSLSGSTYTFTIDVRLNTSSGSSVGFGTPIQAYQSSTSLYTSVVPQLASNADNAGKTLALGSLPRFDFNGDGRDDLSLQVFRESVGCQNGGTCQYYDDTTELISGGLPGSPTFTGHLIYSANSQVPVQVALLNFNSDACTDYLVGNTIFVAGCDGSTPSTVTVNPSYTVIGAMDWNGDGLTDILVANGSTVGVFLSNGSGLGGLTTTSIPYSSSNTYFTFDANGDGLDDLLYSTTSATYYYLHNGAGQPPDLLSSVTDGYGNSASPTYVSLVGSSDYQEYTDATYPSQNYIGPIYVASQITLSDPSSSSGGTYTDTYKYFGAWTDLKGRGWQSFYAYQFLDSRSGLTFGRYWERAFPSTGMEFQDIVINVNGFSLPFPSQTVNTLPGTIDELSGTQYQQRYFPYFTNSTTSTTEVGGTENGDLITTSSTNYTFDNYGNATAISTTVTDNDPNSPYTGKSWTSTTTNTTDISTNQTTDLAAWCLTMIDETQVAYSSTLSGATGVTRTKTFTPDTPANCRIKGAVTEPTANSGLYKVTETLGFDAFGNINSDTVVGANMPSAPALRYQTSTSSRPPSLRTSHARQR